MMSAWRSAAVLLVACTVLSACGSLLSSNETPINRFGLEPLVVTVNTPGVDGTLVPRLTAIPGLDTDRLLTVGPNGEGNYLAGARWQDYLPELVTSVLKRGLVESGYFRGAASDRDPVADACFLSLEIQQFDTRLDGEQKPVSVALRLVGNLKCGERQAPLVLEQSETVGGTRLSDVVGAYQRAMDAVGRSLYSQLAGSARNANGN